MSCKGYFCPRGVSGINDNKGTFEGHFGENTTSTRVRLLQQVFSRTRTNPTNTLSSLSGQRRTVTRVSHLISPISEQGSRRRIGLAKERSGFYHLESSQKTRALSF
ncbi:unnamed protein product, partial [Vitis vinifera]